MFQSLITCKGFISDEKPDKIRFRQDFADCWIKRKDIEKIQHLEKTSEGDVLSLITMREEAANLLELEGVLE
jgi:hypothetical protein